jgi:hypothetical protein
VSELIAPDRKVITCNYAESISGVAKGALAYVLQTHPGNVHDRIIVMVRSRRRWIEKWESIKRLGGFRVQTIPAEHPFYRRLQGAAGEDKLEQLTREAK